MEEYGGFDKLTVIVTDGDKAVVGSTTGFIGVEQANEPAFHCIVHHEGLCADLLNYVTNIIMGGGNKSLTPGNFIS